LVEANVRETKLMSPDYAGVDPEEAVRDFRARIAHYERAYEPLDESDGSYVQLVDVGRRVVVQGIHGHLLSRLVYFLMNLHVTPRRIWLTRHGESTFNLEQRIGGDPGLSARGRRYAEALAAFLARRVTEPPVVWTSTLKRTLETA